MMTFQTGLSGIRANQVALQVTANNIANADNPHHHRQSVTLAAINSPMINNWQIGSGVSVDKLRRAYNALVEESLTQNISDRSSVDQQLDVLRQIESVLSPGSGALQVQVEALFNELTGLTANPSDAVRRVQVLDRAQSLTQELNAISAGLSRLKLNADFRTEAEVSEVNAKFVELADINRQLKISISLGQEPHQLLDRRDAIVDDLATKLDLYEDKQVDSEFSLLAANRAVYIGEKPPQLKTLTDGNGKLQVRLNGFLEPLNFGGGTLQGLQQLTQHDIPELQKKLEALANQLAFAFDSVQSTGLPISGPHTVLRGQRAIGNASVPLSQLKTVYPVEKGSISISVTNLATGNRRLHSIDIDPATATLNDIASAISGIDHVQAVVDAKGKFSVVAESGFAFDFAGRLESQIDTSGITGTSKIELSGRYTGVDNDAFTYQIVGSGTVGVTNGLRVVVSNLAGQPVADLELGNSYTPGSTLVVGDGVEISFASGTLNDGDTFSSYVVQDGDTTNLLATLGLNTFFSGNSAGNLSVNRELVNDHRLLATSLSGDPADSGNILKLLGKRDQRIDAFGGRTLESFLSETVRNTGANIQLLENNSLDLASLGNRLETERASAIGVDPNEEFVKMMQFQKAFQLSARVVSVADENIQTLLGLVGR